VTAHAFDVKHGLLVPRDPSAWALALAEVEGRTVTLPSPEILRNSISAKQRRYYRGVIVPLVASYATAGKESHDYYHEALLSQFAPKVSGPMGDVLLRTKDDSSLCMNTVQAEEYFARIREWAGQWWSDAPHHGFIPLPREYDVADVLAASAKEAA